MRRTIALLSIVLVGIFSACKKDFELSTIEASLAQFDTLTLNSVFEVHLIQGISNEIKIEGASKILSKVTYTIENNNLIIENNYHGNWMHPKHNKVKIYLTVDQLNRISANETCDIQTDNTLVANEIGLIMTSKLNHANLDVNCSTFYYWNNFPCGGKINLSGSCTNLKLWNVALMAVDASNLSCVDAYVDNASKGDINLRCMHQLSYKIAGEGNIINIGNPMILDKIEASGSGKLIIQ